MPQMGVSVAEGTLIAWRAGVGDAIEAEQTICEISTDKIDTEVPAPVSGTVAEILVAIEQTVPVGTVLARIATAGWGPPAKADAGPGACAPATSAAATSTPVTVRPPSTVTASNGASMANAQDAPARRRYSPVVQRIAAQHEIDLEQVTGTGRDGRVRKQDVLAAVGTQTEAPLHIESPYRPEPDQPARGGLSRMRRQIGEHMKRSLTTAATCTTWIEADMGRVEEARTRLKLTALPFVARATIAALREYPALNAWLDGDHYTRHDDAVHLGIAVSLGEDGLIVPVIRDAHELSVEGLAARIREIARRARLRGADA